MTEETPHDQWIKLKIMGISTSGKVEIAEKLLEFYLGNFDPNDLVKGKNWSYDGSTSDLWATLSNIVGDDVTWD